MPKPLELVVYPPIPDEPNMPSDNWDVPGIESIGHANWRLDREYEHYLAGEKRLTDAELAAEYHASMASANFALSEVLPWLEEMKRHNTIAKFATYPHYDEESA